MKLVPFTERVRKDLIEDGYTHLQLKSSVSPQSQEYAGGRMLKVYQARKNVNYVSTECYAIDSDTVNTMLHDSETDYYVSYIS